MKRTKIFLGSYLRSLVGRPLSKKSKRKGWYRALCTPYGSILFLFRRDCMKLFVIGGRAKSGKNTFGEMLREELKDYGYRPCVMHITEPLYSYARTYFDWDGNENDKPREFLQKMGIEIIRDKMDKKDFLLNRLFEDIEILSNFFDVFIIVDARLVREFEILKKKYDDVVTIKINRKMEHSILTLDEQKHITELEVDLYNDYDYIIENHAIEDLEKASIEIIRNEEDGG